MWNGLSRRSREFEEALHLREKFGSAERLAKQVRELHDIYCSRAEAGAGSRRVALGSPLVWEPCGRGTSHASALLHFFLPTEMVKVWLPLSEALDGMPGLGRRPLRVLDLGASDGAAAIGALLMLEEAGAKGPVELVMAGTDPVAAHVSGAALKALGEVSRLRVSARDEMTGRTNGDDRFDLVLLMDHASRVFSAEEYVEGTLGLVRQLLRDKVKKSGVVIVIEPASKAISRRVSEVSCAFRESGTLYAPCPAGHTCGELVRGGFCCHCIDVPLSPLTQSVAARAGLVRHEVNFSYLTFTQESARLAEPYGEHARIIGFPRKVGGGFSYHCCVDDGLKVGVAPRQMPDGSGRGGKLKHGALVRMTGEGKEVARGAE